MVVHRGSERIAVSMEIMGDGKTVVLYPSQSDATARADWPAVERFIRSDLERQGMLVEIDGLIGD